MRVGWRLLVMRCLAVSDRLRLAIGSSGAQRGGLPRARIMGTAFGEWVLLSIPRTHVSIDVWCHYSHLAHHAIINCSTDRDYSLAPSLTFLLTLTTKH